MRSMVINMEEAKLQTLVQIKAFLDGTSEVIFRVPKEEHNQFIGRVLKRFGYAPHGRVDKGILLRYIERMTGLSRQQVTRLVRQYRKDGKLSKQPCTPTQGFTYRYTAADVLSLAELDVNALFWFLVMRALNGWRASRFPTFTTCAGAHRTRTNGGTGARRAPPAFPSANAAPRSQTEYQATSA